MFPHVQMRSASSEEIDVEVDIHIELSASWKTDLNLTARVAVCKGSRPPDRPPCRRASARSASVPGACRIPFLGEGAELQIQRAAYSTPERQESPSSPFRPTMGSTSTWPRIARGTGRTAMLARRGRAPGCPPP